MKGFRFEFDRENPNERKWSIAEAADGSLIVTAFADDDERSDQMVIERFEHFLNLRPRDPTIEIPVTIVSEVAEAHSRMIRGGMDPARMPPILVPRAKVVELFQALDKAADSPIMYIVPMHGIAQIMGAKIAWHADLDVAVTRQL